LQQNAIILGVLLGPVKPEDGFFTSEINVLIDANYPENEYYNKGELLVEAYK